MSKPILIETKTVFAPRGTATYTPKWSIVVLAVACLGVLKFNRPPPKTFVPINSALRKAPAHPNISVAPLALPLGTESQLHPTAKASGMETNSIGPATQAHLQFKNKDKNQ